MATLDNLVVTNALPVLQRNLGASVAELQWFINAYALSFASFILLATALGDRFGRRRVFVIGIAVFTGASALCAVSSSPETLIAARALQGIGGAALMPLSLAILVGSVSPRLRPFAIGVWGGVAGLGVAVGPLVGGAIVEGLSWNAIFWLNVPVGLVAIPLAYRALLESRGARVRLDFLGLVLAGLGVFGLVFGIVNVPDGGWSTLPVRLILLSGVLLIGAFVWWEGRSSNPLLPLALFRDRSFSASISLGVAFSIGVFGSIFIVVQFFQVVQGYSPLKAGVLSIPWTMAPLAISPLAGFLAPRFGTRALLLVGLTAQACGLAWIAVAMSPTVPYSHVVVAFALEGIGMGLVVPPAATAVLANMRPQDHAKASGANSTLREVGVALGIAIVPAVFTASGGRFTPTEFADAAVPSLWTGVAFVVAAIVIATRLPAGRGAGGVAAER
jgi:EmrB/QacA subfamily drug resistance transporter